MTSTIPTTLAEYQQFVRREALKVQVDMGWPDDKLNETLKALGLPEKQNTMVPLLVTGKMFVLINVPDAGSREEAEATLSGKTDAELRTLLVAANASLGRFSQFATEITTLPTVFAVGDLDTTLSNGTVYHAKGRGGGHCENYDRGASGNYCTLPRGHEGTQHAVGDGHTILAVWDVQPDAF